MGLWGHRRRVGDELEVLGSGEISSAVLLTFFVPQPVNFLWKRIVFFARPVKARRRKGQSAALHDQTFAQKGTQMGRL